MSYASRQRSPRMRKATERPSPLPVDLRLVTVRQRGVCTTVSAIVEPGGALAVAVGDWRVTVPGCLPGAATRVMFACSPARSSALCASAAVRPTTSGTGTGGGPALRVARTRVLLSTYFPAPGRWEMTVPALRLA